MKLETTVSDEVSITARLLIDEAERAREPASTLNRDDFSEKVEARDMEDVRVLKRELCSARPEARVNEPASVLKIEFFSAGLAPRINELVRDRNIEFFSDKLEAIASEAVGTKVQEVAVPACIVQETDVVLEA